jgi:hypothetical protein
MFAEGKVATASFRVIQILPGTKALARAGQQQATDSAALLRLLKDRNQFPRNYLIQGIIFIRAIKGNRRDAFFFFQDDCLVISHFVTPEKLTQRNQIIFAFFASLREGLLV